MWLLLAIACPPPESSDWCPTPGNSCRVAGTGQLGFNGDGKAGAESWLYWPSSVDFEPDGRLVIADFNNMRIRRWEEDHTLSTIAGSGDHAWSTPNTQVLKSALENPVDVAYLPDGTFFIAALHEARILYVDASGIVAPYAGTGDEGFAGDEGPATSAWLSEAAGIATDDAGNLYIADTQNHCIRMVDPNGVIHTLAGHGSAGYQDGADDAAMFNTPQRLAWFEGALYIADSYNHAIRKMDLETGETSTIAGTGLGGFSGDEGPAVNAQLNSPYGLTVRESGLYIADTGNNRIRWVDPEGIIHTLAGTGIAGFTGDDGPALEATYSWPIDVAVDDDGNVFVADMRNGAVRMVRTP